MVVKHLKFRPMVRTETIHHIKKQLNPLKPYYKMYLGKETDPIEYLRKQVTKLIDKNILVHRQKTCVNIAMFTNFVRYIKKEIEILKANRKSKDG